MQPDRDNNEQNAQTLASNEPNAGSHKGLRSDPIRMQITIKYADQREKEWCGQEQSRSQDVSWLIDARNEPEFSWMSDRTRGSTPIQLSVALIPWKQELKSTFVRD